MPTCGRCGEWYSPSQGFTDCPVCGGALRSGDGLQRLEEQAAALGLSPEDYQALRKAERKAREQAILDEKEVRRRRRLETEAAAAGLSVEEYQERRLRECQLHQWNSWDGCEFIAVGILAPLAVVVVGVVVFGALVILGRSPWAAIGGSLSGLGAVLLGLLLTLGVVGAFDRLAPHSGFVRRRGDDVYTGLVLAALALPPALTLVVAILLS